MQKTRNHGVIHQMGGFDPVGAPNTVYYPLGLVTTPQNAFWTIIILLGCMASETSGLQAFVLPLAMCGVIN